MSHCLMSWWACQLVVAFLKEQKVEKAFKQTGNSQTEWVEMETGGFYLGGHKMNGPTWGTFERESWYS